MTKTLTEQWREGTLKSGTYYIKVKFGDNLIYTFDYYNDRNNEWSFFRDIRDVLDIVPSYEEYRELLDLNIYEKDRKKVMGLEDKVKRLQEQKHKVIALIKDGRFVEALQLLEGK